MWGKVGIGLWLVLAVVTWNVAFDTARFRAAARATREHVEVWQQGGVPPPLDASFRPAVGQAALDASAWAGGVLLVGAGLWSLSRRRATRT